MNRPVPIIVGEVSSLSDREQRIFDEIEKSLYKDDPDFVRKIRREPRGRSHKVGIRPGIVTFVAGFLVLIAFFATGMVLVGVVAFAAMVAGIVMIASAARSLAALERPATGWVRGAAERWERRLRDRRHRR